jgi:hypothetical protein
MHKITSTISCFLLLSVMAIAQPPKGKALPGDTYGNITTIDGAVDIAQIPAQLAEKGSFDTKVKAKVLDVCSKKGCWLKLAVNDSTEAFVKMKDYAFFAPLAIKGKTIVMDAKASIKTTSVEELQHYAEDAKKSKEEIAAIKEPEKEISFLASGIQVVE